MGRERNEREQSGNPQYLTIHTAKESLSLAV